MKCDLVVILLRLHTLHRHFEEFLEALGLCPCEANPSNSSEWVRSTADNKNALRFSLSLFLANVKRVHPLPGAHVDHGVRVVLTEKHRN